MKEQIKISAKIKSSNMEIELYNDEDAKLIEKYYLLNDEIIILSLPVKRQSLMATMAS